MFTFSSSAQRRGFNLGLNAGYGSTTLYHDNFVSVFPGTAYDMDPGSFYSVGVQAGYMFSDHFGLFTGIARAYHRWYMTAEKTIYRSDNVNEQQYTIVPIYLHAITANYKKVGIYLDAGAELSWLQGGCKWRSVFYKNDIEYTVQEGNGVDDMRLFVISPFIGLGIAVPISKRFTLFAGPKGQLQAMNNFNSPDNGKGHLLSYSLNTSLYMRLGKAKPAKK